MRGAVRERFSRVDSARNVSADQLGGCDRPRPGSVRSAHREAAPTTRWGASVRQRCRRQRRLTPATSNGAAVSPVPWTGSTTGATGRFLPQAVAYVFRKHVGTPDLWQGGARATAPPREPPPRVERRATTLAGGPALAPALATQLSRVAPWLSDSRHQMGTMIKGRRVSAMDWRRFRLTLARRRQRSCGASTG